MAVAALVAYVVYLVLAFGMRSVQQYRRTGDIGFRGVSGRPGSLEWWGGVLFVLAVLFGLAAPILQLAGVLSPLLDNAVVHVVGAVLAVAGIAGTLAAQQSMGASWRIGVDRAETTALVTTGAFGFARNPIFTAMIAAGAGIGALAPNPLAVGAVVALVAAIEIQVRAVEEPYLLASHGSAYRDYATHVGRFLPGLGRLA
ncbi:isoprenylcysteine carboxylmethyltransferase family protein [Amycolatopsis sp. 195334CR]|uniref:methyltransferase family protein n=1 Tax=Amycolatopsis sp. 195334CR TaxID=2814588 RepID=UPI001A8FF69D|nr:isoprenylcysteine carboxylmethyltransferase family protein [Amycolatopsis sp. 195334CR]MBN6038294.1 isoprenylcysteine carboxylmethyltransferase family protein [Amycolatopsis sp. 195334CR]